MGVKKFTFAISSPDEFLLFFVLSLTFLLWFCGVDPRSSHQDVALRAPGNLPVSYILTGTYHQQITGNLPEIYHTMYFLVILKYLGGDTGAKPYN